MRLFTANANPKHLFLSSLMVDEHQQLHVFAGLNGVV